jgi:hypothetical protein
MGHGATVAGGTVAERMTALPHPGPGGDSIPGQGARRSGFNLLNHGVGEKIDDEIFLA